jgi:hypothetical protein
LYHVGGWAKRTNSVAFIHGENFTHYPVCGELSVDAAYSHCGKPRGGTGAHLLYD